MTDCVNVISEFNRTEIVRAKETKSKWSQTRLVYDASATKLEHEKKKSKSSKVKEVRNTLENTPYLQLQIYIDGS